MQQTQRRSRVLATSVASLALFCLSFPAFAAPEVSPTATNDADITPIAEIQGDGASTPFAGETVTTKGVVTASYPTGTFSGYYQTPGTGGDVKTEGKSDGLRLHRQYHSPESVTAW